MFPFIDLYNSFYAALNNGAKFKITQDILLVVS